MRNPTGLERNGSAHVWSLFTRAWTLVLLVDRANWGRGFDELATWMIWIGFLLVWQSPTSIRRFALVCAGHLAWVLGDFVPAMFIHRFVAGLFDATVLAVLVVEAGPWRRHSEATRQSSGDTVRTRIVTALGGPALAFVAIGMGAAGFAKLNRDFLDVELSCGMVLYRWMQQSPVLPFLPAGPLAERAAIVATIIGELGGALLVVFRRTRGVGLVLLSGTWIAIGLISGFHLFEFAGVFMAITVLFVDVEWFGRGSQAAVDLWARIGPRFGSGSAIATWGAAIVWGAWIAACSLAVWGAALGIDAHAMRELMRALSVGMAVGFVVVGAIGWGRVRGRKPGSRAHRAPGHRRHAVAWMFAAWFLVNEASGYFGLWHMPSMTMAGNLWLQPGHSNHLVVEQIWVNDATRPIFIERSSTPALVAGDWMPWLLFADTMAQHPRARVTFRDNGVRERVVAGKDERFARRRWLAVMLNLRAWRDATGPLRCNKAPPGMNVRQWDAHVKAVVAARASSLRE